MKDIDTLEAVLADAVESMAFYELNGSFMDSFAYMRKIRSELDVETRRKFDKLVAMVGDFWVALDNLEERVK